MNYEVKYEEVQKPIDKITVEHKVIGEVISK